ncbi:hypothetical protein CHS0354_001144 [Potamilus streckersoni]|uniref:FHF complex subunit HOOK-interacting protein C-terminal domain-containing protein n=1 Tax=Potamilus streckersoni TaxID=2493646 RepID=A0AAE0VF85_9BIVA|nr:hypothetical protein CHS0354_001144 [Potamilus streckersoni]
MSWFKKGRTGSKSSQKTSDIANPNSNENFDGRSRRDTDPQTCLEVFQNHWSQAIHVIDSKHGMTNPQCSSDEVEAVIQNFEQMVTLLAAEEAYHGTPGPILHFFIENEILEKFFGWCHLNTDYREKLILEQLRMFEHLINHSHQILLIHKSVIRPLLNLLAFCVDCLVSKEVENHLVLILHQICICISKETLVLESFFTMSADHGSTKFVIFSLLISYIHHEGSVGQQARDALLLIMALSSKYTYMGQYIANNTDFCPVLATGLSGLYSDLPRKINISFEDWRGIADEDIAEMPDMMMFLNTLEFCNAVVQIAHPLVREQLISYIYNGFLVPVLGPALHQNSREEVITATAYLELFLRKVTEPALIKTFLKFILTEKSDEIVILESLITRINSSSKLSIVSLALFYTLVNLNCEDVMFQLVFRYLVPCTHVMISQRPAVRDVDTYSKSAEKFLSLRPTCCLPELSESPEHGEIKHEPLKTNFPPGSDGSKLEHFETSYLEYLHEARTSVRNCVKACQKWSVPYDGENPAPDSIMDLDEVFTSKSEISKTDGINGCDDAKNRSYKGEITLGSSGLVEEVTNEVIKQSQDAETKAKFLNIIYTAEINSEAQITDQKEYQTSNDAIFVQSKGGIYGISSGNVPVESRLDDIKVFLSFLDETDAPVDKNLTFEESLKSLDSVLSSVSALVPIVSRTSTPRKELSHGSKSLTDFCDNNLDISAVAGNTDNTVDKNEKNFQDFSQNATPFQVKDNSKFCEQLSKQEGLNRTDFEVLETPSLLNAGCDKRHSETKPDPSTFLEISMSSIVNGTDNSKALPDTGSVEAERKSYTSGEKSVRFSETSMQSSHNISKSVSGISVVAKMGSTQPNVGPFMTALLSKLEGMMQNSLQVNLMLTGLLARLAAYPQPLLRSYLLNHNLVFQPTVKSLVQILTVVRQKVDHFSYTVQNFEQLLLRARRTLAAREGLLPERGKSISPSPEFIHLRTRATSVYEVPSKEKRHRTLSDLLFKRSPVDKKQETNSKKAQQQQRLEIIPGKGFRFINRKMNDTNDNPVESLKTRNAVYCALVLEEFIKELAALAQEHAVLSLNEDCSNL